MAGRCPLGRRTEGGLASKVSLIEPNAVVGKTIGSFHDGFGQIMDRLGPMGVRRPGQILPCPRPGTMSPRLKVSGCSSWAYVHECGSRSGRQRLNCAVWRNLWPSMWS